MERPVIDICGTSFYVDATAMDLREVGKEDNCLNAIEMLDLGNHREFLFDKGLKNFFAGRWDLPNDPATAEWVFIPSLESIDEEGMKLLISQGHYKTMIEELEGLPAVDIAGHQFLRNDLRKEFRQADNLFNILRFDDIMPEGNDMVCYFDTRTKNAPMPDVFSSFEKSDKMPDHVIRVVIEPAYQNKQHIQSKETTDLPIKAMEQNSRKKKKGRGI